MKASSESGECASLISRVSVKIFDVAWPVMGWSFLYAAAPDCPARSVQNFTKRYASPRRQQSERRQKREDVSDARTCAARAAFCSASLAQCRPLRQTFWRSERFFAAVRQHIDSQSCFGQRRSGRRQANSFLLPTRNSFVHFSV